MEVAVQGTGGPRTIHRTEGSRRREVATIKVDIIREEGRGRRMAEVEVEMILLGVRLMDLEVELCQG